LPSRSTVITIVLPTRRTLSIFAPVSEITAAEFRRATEVTYLGTVHGTMSALKRMRPRNRGKIVQVGSALAYRAIPLQSAYCGSKHAIHGFFESLRSELIHDKSNIKLSMIQMPAMNTTQFGWVKSYLKNKPKPMGQIYEPEVAAKAVVEVARNPQRELYVGYPTVETIWGNKMVPEYLDKYLAKTGFKGQQTNEPESPNRQNNLWQPVPGDHGARGTFSAKAWDSSPEVWMATHKKSTWGLLAGIVLGIGAVVFMKNRD